MVHSIFAKETNKVENVKAFVLADSNTGYTYDWMLYTGMPVHENFFAFISLVLLFLLTFQGRVHNLQSMVVRQLKVWSSHFFKVLNTNDIMCIWTITTLVQHYTKN